MSQASPERKIRVSVPAQELHLIEGCEITARFPISTSGFGLGSEPGSNKTPLGKFEISEKIGHGAPEGAVFRSRVATGEIGSPESSEDLVQTRILWLAGLEPHNANTKERYIYIHGTNHEESIGQPCSHGCVRMKNTDVVRLFDLVEPGTEVCIES